MSDGEGDFEVGHLRAPDNHTESVVSLVAQRRGTTPQELQSNFQEQISALKAKNEANLRLAKFRQAY